MFFRKVDWFSTDNTALYPKRPNSLRFVVISLSLLSQIRLIQCPGRCWTVSGLRRPQRQKSVRQLGSQAGNTPDNMKEEAALSPWLERAGHVKRSENVHMLHNESLNNCHVYLRTNEIRELVRTVNSKGSRRKLWHFPKQAYDDEPRPVSSVSEMCLELRSPTSKT
jgi:hypothetical protein